MSFLITGPKSARATLLLAHGAGAGMDSPFLEAMAAALAERALCVVRFEFAYMAARRAGASRRPPPRVERLADEYRQAVTALRRGDAQFADRDLRAAGPLLIGGKSLGGRVATMLAEDLWRQGLIAGAFALGYPFHPPGKPEQWRTAHLESLACPLLICQGTRDPFGSRAEVAALTLGPGVELCWLDDGDHDLKPRKRSGVTWEQNISAAADAIARHAEKVMGH